MRRGKKKIMAVSEDGMRRGAGVGAAVVLAGLGLMHAAWALGSPWPARDAATLVEHILGPFSKDGAPPPPAPTWGIAALLWAATLTLLGRLGLWGDWLPRWPFRWASWILSGVLMTRAIVGFVLSAFVPRVRNSTFGRWNALLYSPLCLALALAALAVASRQDDAA